MDRDCFVDTTVLAELLLKANANRRKARAKLREYNRSILPIYAIKELKAGPLKHYIWLHNRLVDLKSFSRTLRAIHNSFHRLYLKGTAEEALEMATQTLVGSNLASANTPQKTDAALADAYRLSIRRRIDLAWRERRKVTTDLADELPCYAEIAHEYNEQTGFIDDEHRRCELSDECSLAAGFRKRRGELRKLISAIKESDRPEDRRRRGCLYELLARPPKTFDPENCLSLGDAYFALQCPKGCAILTSNYKDHILLGNALGKDVDEYRTS
jgi:hypothetical protein